LTHSSFPAPHAAEGSSGRGKNLPKMPTGIAGFDDVLRGGLPERRTTLLMGGPGSGKTIVAIETLYRAAMAGRPGVFVSFEETADALHTNTAALGWDLQTLADQKRLTLLDPKFDWHAVRAGDFGVQGLLAVLGGQAEAIGAKLLVLDAIDVLMRLFNDPSRRDDELYFLHHWLVENRYTAILTAKLRSKGQLPSPYSFLDFLADCVVVLDQRIVDQVNTRRLHVIKYRGSGYASNECPFVITPQGVVLIPVASAALQQQPLGPRCSAGNPVLDAMLGSGYRQGSSILIAGPTGSGKTTLACTFACNAGQRGERTLYVSFEEAANSLLSAMRSPGLNLAPLLEAGTLEILTAMPESIGVEEHLLRILQAMARFRPAHMVVDAISAANRMGSRKAAFDFLVRLISTCREQGITCIYLNQTRRGLAADQISGIGISSLMDTALVLDYRWEGNQLERSLFVLKSRGTRHSHEVHRLTISDEGIHLVPWGAASWREGE
jgi:circadian clock protein KaiC